MHALSTRILTFNLVATTAVFYVAARLYLLPRLGKIAPRAVIVPILLLHSLRHLGLMFLTRGATMPGMPLHFSRPAAIGDLISAVLAMAALPAVVQGRPIARTLVWVFNIVGSLDMVTAITLATVYNAAPFMGAAYWIPAFWVPALLVTHYIVFRILLSGRPLSTS